MPITYSVTRILEIPQMIYFQYNPTLFSLECRLSVGLFHGLHNGLYKLQIVAQTVIIETLRYSGRGRGGRQPEVECSILGTN